MKCVVCDEKTQSRMKNVPCCSKCRKDVKAKRDEMFAEKNRLGDLMNGTLDKDPIKHVKLFNRCPNGTLKNALIQSEIDKNDNKKEKENG